MASHRPDPISPECRTITFMRIRVDVWIRQGKWTDLNRLPGKFGGGEPQACTSTVRMPRRIEPFRSNVWASRWVRQISPRFTFAGQARWNRRIR